MKFELLRIYARNHLIGAVYIFAFLSVLLALRCYFYGVPQKNTELQLLSVLSFLGIFGFFKLQSVYRAILAKGTKYAHAIVQIMAVKPIFWGSILALAFWPLQTDFLYDHLLGYAFVACALVLNVSVGAVFLPLFIWDLLVFTGFVSVVVFMNYGVQETAYLGMAVFVFALSTFLIGLRLNRSSQQLLRKSAEFNKAARAAARANKAKSDFLAVMSHEIRTPMNGVLGMVDFLKETELTQEQREAVDTILGCSDALLNTLNDILDISKIEAGKFSINNEAYYLHDLVNRISRLVQINLQNKDVEYKCEISPDVPKFIIGDEKRIQQVIINFMNNAMKFTSEGHVGLYVSCHKKNDIPTLLFEVHDTGIGISHKNQQKLFKQFAQADSTIATQYGGTGLGLFISNKLVSLMEGQVGVESEEGKGSVFWFELPCNAVENQEEMEQQAARSYEDEKIPAQNILLADDNELNQMIVKRMLENRGHNISVARNGEEAVMMVRQNPYDMILMDINMPFVDGIEATRQIKKMGSGRDKIPVIALTASTKNEVIHDCLHAGMVDYLLKPIEKAKLFEAVYHFSADKSQDPRSGHVVSAEDVVYTKARNEKFEVLVEEFGEDYAIDLARQFIGAITEKLQYMDECIESGDHDAVYNVAHDLSGMTGNVGLDDSLEFSRRLERKAMNKEGDYDTLKAELDQSFAKEKKFFDEYFQ